MNFIHRNKLYIGIILGAILPWITYFILNFIYDQLRSPSPIDPYREAMLIERISIFGNLAGFYYFLNKGHYRSVRGIVVMTFIYAAAYGIVFMNRP